MHLADLSTVAVFTGSDTWFLVLLLAHVAGAIIGLGPTFAFAIIGPAIPKQSSQQASLALLKIMESIERGMVLPILLVVQLSSGILLIFNRGLDVDFFSGKRLWLIAGILLYAAAMILVLAVDLPAMTKLVHKGERGEIDEEFQRLSKIPQTLGPILTVIAVAIIVLMVWKPGSGCGALYRC